MIEVINDWKKNPVPPPARKAARSKPITPDEIGARLATFEPRILNVCCFDDVQYPWVQLVFDELIAPAVALRAGAALAEVIGDEFVYLNSLRPKAVYFVLDLAADPKPDLPASRYGALLADIERIWTLPAARRR